MNLLKLLDGKDVQVGVIDVASDEVETPEQVADVIGEAMKYVAKEKILRAPIAAWRRCGADIASAKLEALAGARSWRGRSLGNSAPGYL